MDFLLALPCWSSDGYCTRGILGFPTLFSLSLLLSLFFPFLSLSVSVSVSVSLSLSLSLFAPVLYMCLFVEVVCDCSVDVLGTVPS